MKIVSLKRLGLVSAAAIAVVVLAAPASVGATGRKHYSQKKANHKVTICHRTNSVTNRYRKTTISFAAFDGKHKNDHTSHTGPYAYSEAYARELKKQHIKWGDVADASKCEKPAKKHVQSKKDKKDDCKPEQPKQQTEKENRPGQVLAAVKTDTPSAPTPAPKVLANTGVPSSVSAIAAFAILASVGAATYFSRPKLQV